MILLVMAQNIYDFSYEMKRKLHHKITSVILFILILLIVISLIIKFLLFTVIVRSDSMNPSIEKYNAIIVSPWVTPNNVFFAKSNIIKRGQIFVLNPKYTRKLNFGETIVDTFCRFFTFQNFSPYDLDKRMTSSSLVRRVIGLPGDSVYVKDFVVYIKPAGTSHYLTEFEVANKSYDVIIDKTSSNNPGNINLLKDTNEIVLKENQYFVLCDNRSVGVDSRLWGPVSQKQLRGRVIYRYFPINEFESY